VREDRWDRARVHPDNAVAYNWAGLSNLAGLYGKTVGIIGLGEVGSMAAKMAHARASSTATAIGFRPSASKH
jgi:phosphoglycerate dehydrogenase-like enzyme